MMDAQVKIRSETPQDVAAIRQITAAAFEEAEHSSGTEAVIVDDLRAAGALTVTLVAVAAGQVVGHVAFSPITVEGESGDWYGLGPLSVRPDWQGKGIGSQLNREGLARLVGVGGKGCVVLGDPNYYRRFHFEADPELRLEGVPAEYFMRLVLQGPVPKGRVAYHAAFEAHS